MQWRGPIIFVFINYYYYICHFMSSSDQFLFANILKDSPETPQMMDAFIGYILYGAALLCLSLFIFYLLLDLISGYLFRNQHKDTFFIDNHAIWSCFRPQAIILIMLTTFLSISVYIETTVFSNYGVHFYEYDIVSIFIDTTAARDLGIRFEDLRNAALATLFALILGAALFFLSRKASLLMGGLLSVVALFCLLISGAAGLFVYKKNEIKIRASRHEFFESLPLYHYLLFARKNKPHIPVEPRLGINGYPVITERDPFFPALKNRKNIVIFLSDSLRGDHVRRDLNLTPNMFAFKDRYDPISPKRHYTTSPFTDQGTFGLLYGLNAYHFYPFMKHRIPSYPLEILKKNGYIVEMINGSRFSKFPTNYMDGMFDRVVYPADDDETILLFKEFLKERNQDGRPYLILLFIFAPHYPNPAKPPFQRYKTYTDGMDLTLNAEETRINGRNKYRNSVIQVDDYFRQVFEMIQKDLESNRTIFLATADHGTELWDHGIFGHGKSTFWNEKAIVPFFLYLPGLDLTGKQQSPSVGSHTDFWPTVFDYLDPVPFPPSQAYSNGISLLASPISGPENRRKLFLTGRYFPYANRSNLALDDQYKYWFQASNKDKDGSLGFEISRITDLKDRSLFMENVLRTNRHMEIFNLFEKEFWRFLSYEDKE